MFIKENTMKTVLIVIVSFTMTSCYSDKISNIKLDGSNNIIFKDGDVIYFTNLDTTFISFHYTDDPLVKERKSKDIILSEYIVEYNNMNLNEDNIFEPIERSILKASLSPEQYICDQYNAFANVLGSDWGTLTKYKHKNLTIKQIDWDMISYLAINENYYRPDDSLRLEITFPKNLENFCIEINSKFPDANYIMLCSNVYVTYNIFKGIEVSGSWTSGQYIDGYYVGGGYNEGYSYEDAYIIAPKMVIDLNNAKILSIDARSHGFRNWENFTRELQLIIYEEAKYYNISF